ncbi:MAG TPA: hypothetical protein VIM99_05230 [Blastocatellia bacterium]
MTTGIARRIIVSILAIAVFPLIALSQAKDAAPEDRFAKLDGMRAHCQNYGEGKEATVFVHGWSRKMLDETIWKAGKINAPTPAVMAKQPQWDAEYEKFVRELVPGIDYQMWEGVSHFLMMDEPQKFNDAVLVFLKKNKLIKN